MIVASATVAPSKRFPDGNNRRFSIDLENESVVTSSWVTPRLQLLMHVLDEPTGVPRIAQTLVVYGPHVLVTCYFVYHDHQRSI